MERALFAGTAMGPAVVQVVADPVTLQKKLVIAPLMTRPNSRKFVLPGAAVIRTLRSRATIPAAGESVATFEPSVVRFDAVDVPLAAPNTSPEVPKVLILPLSTAP